MTPKAAEAVATSTSCHFCHRTQDAKKLKIHTRPPTQVCKLKNKLKIHTRPPTQVCKLKKLKFHTRPYSGM